MPVSLQRVRGKYRLMEPGGGIAKNKHGTPIDGGGHISRVKALAQLRAVNMHYREKHSRGAT